MPGVWERQLPLPASVAIRLVAGIQQVQRELPEFGHCGHSTG